MLALKQIVDKEFQHVFDLLPNIYEPHGFIHELEDSSKDPNEDSSEGSSEGPSRGRSDGPRRGPTFSPNCGLIL